MSSYVILTVHALTTGCDLLLIMHIDMQWPVSVLTGLIEGHIFLWTALPLTLPLNEAIRLCLITVAVFAGYMTGRRTCLRTCSGLWKVSMLLSEIFSSPYNQMVTQLHPLWSGMDLLLLTCVCGFCALMLLLGWEFFLLGTKVEVKVVHSC